MRGWMNEDEINGYGDDGEGLHTSDLRARLTSLSQSTIDHK